MEGEDGASLPIPVVKQEVEVDYILPDQEDMFNDGEGEAKMETKGPAADKKKRGGGSGRASRPRKKVVKEEPVPEEAKPESGGVGLRKRPPRNAKRTYRESPPPPIKKEEEEVEEDYRDSGGDSDSSGEESKRARKRKRTPKKAKPGGKNKKEDGGEGSEELKLKPRRQRKKQAPEEKLKRMSEHMAAKRAKMTPEELEEDRRKSAERTRSKRARMTSEEREADRKRKAEQTRAKRAAMTPEQMAEFRKKQRERTAARRAQLRAEREEKGLGKDTLTEEEKSERRMKGYLARQAYKAKLTEEEQAKKRRARLLKTYAKRLEETPEEREERRQKHVMLYLNQRVNMTPEELEEFRKKRRELQRQYKYKRATSYSQYSDEKKQRLKEYYRDRKSKDTPEQREARLEMYKRNAAKQKEKKILMAEGYTKEEAMDILKQTRPELFPHSAPRGRPTGVTIKYRRRETVPYTPVADGRGNTKGRPLPVSKEELAEYLADKEKWEKNYDLKWKKNQTSSKSKNRLPLTTDDISNSRDSHESEYRSEVSSTVDQELTLPVVKSETPRFASQPAISPDSLPCTSSSVFGATEPPVAAPKDRSQSVEPGFVIKNGSGADYDIPTHMSDGGFSPEYSAPSSPVPCMDFPENMTMTVSEVKQEFVSPMKITAVEVFDDRDDSFHDGTADSPKVANEINEPTRRRKQIRKAEYCCELCGKIYKSKRYYTAHMFESHADREPNPKIFTCPAEGCSMTFNNSTSCRIHYRAHTEVKVNKRKRGPNVYGTYGNTVPSCSKCDITFDKLCELQMHAREVHAADYRSLRSTTHTCDHCGKNFKQKCTLDDHVKRIHLGMGDICDLCGRSFQSAVKLWRHKVDTHGMKDLDPSTIGNIQVQLCMFCGEYIFRNMKTHIEQQHREHLEEYMNTTKSGKAKSSSEFHCDLCDKTILQFSRESHIRSRHPEELLKDGQDTRVTCEICQRKFWTEKNLATHILHWHCKNIQFQVEATVKDNGEVEPLNCQFCSLEQVDRTMYKMHVIDQHSEELVSLVKKKVEEGTVLSKQQLTLIRNRRWRKNHPEADKRRHMKDKAKGKKRARQLKKTKEKPETPKPKSPKPKTSKTRTRSKKKAVNSRPSPKLPKVLIKNCGRKSTKKSLSAKDKKILERFPDIKWGHPVVVVKLLSDSETHVLLAKESKQDVEQNIKKENVEN